MVETDDRIRHARTLLDSGRPKAAARILSDVVADCYDSAQAVEIRRLADRGAVMAGPFAKVRWRQVARLADQHAGWTRRRVSAEGNEPTHAW